MISAVDLKPCKYKQCKHKPIPEIENKLYPDYDHDSYQRVYIELKEEGGTMFTK